MRLSFALVFGWSVAVTASAAGKPDYLVCFDAARPPDCLARMGAEQGGVGPEVLLDAILRHGMVDLVPRHSRKLLRAIPSPIRGFEGMVDLPPASLYEANANAALRHSTPKLKLAAAALLAASRYETDPFSNATVRQMMKKAGDDPIIPALAIVLWVDSLAMGETSMEKVRVTGLPALWSRTEALKDKAPEFVRDVAGRLAFLDQLEPQIEKFYQWYALHPGARADDKAEAASQMVRYFQMAEEAATLMREGGDQASQSFNVASIHRSITLARLQKRYGAAEARSTVEFLLTSSERHEGEISLFDEWTYELLGEIGAVSELRWLAQELAQRGEAKHPDPNAAAWFASASEAYRAAGDLEQAREIARRGLPYAREGWREAKPVIALYRAGAIDEAVRTGLLSGDKRYRNAEMAGEKADPVWAIEDPSWQGQFNLVYQMQSSKNRVQQREAYDALVRSCGVPLASCRKQTQMDIALVAAAMGDKVRMREAYAAIVAGFNNKRDKGWDAIRLAALWGHAEEVMQDQSAQ